MNKIIELLKNLFPNLSSSNRDQRLNCWYTIISYLAAILLLVIAVSRIPAPLNKYIEAAKTMFSSMIESISCYETITTYGKAVLSVLILIEIVSFVIDCIFALAYNYSAKKILNGTQEYYGWRIWTRTIIEAAFLIEGYYYVVFTSDATAFIREFVYPNIVIKYVLFALTLWAAVSLGLSFYRRVMVFYAPDRSEEFAEPTKKAEKE